MKGKIFHPEELKDVLQVKDINKFILNKTTPKRVSSKRKMFTPLESLKEEKYEEITDNPENDPVQNELYEAIRKTDDLKKAVEDSKVERRKLRVAKQASLALQDGLLTSQARDLAKRDKQTTELIIKTHEKLVNEALASDNAKKLASTQKALDRVLTQTQAKGVG